MIPALPVWRRRRRRGLRGELCKNEKYFTENIVVLLVIKWSAALLVVKLTHFFSKVFWIKGPIFLIKHKKPLSWKTVFFFSWQRFQLMEVFDCISSINLIDFKYLLLNINYFFIEICQRENSFILITF